MSIAAPMSHPFLTEADQAVIKSTVAEFAQSGQFHLDSNGLSPYAVHSVVGLLDSLAEGQGVTIIPDQVELTVAQAAEILETSEAGVHEMFDMNLFKYRQEGDQYWIDRDSLLKFEARRRWRLEGVAEITRLSQEMGLYDSLYDVEPYK